MKNKVDLHTHSLFSRHAYSSLTENIEKAYDVGLEYYGFSDHQHDRFNFGADRHNFINLGVIPNTYKGMKILKGVELNVGEYLKDYIDFYTKNCDYGIGSIHAYDHGYDHTKEENTKFYLEAINYPLIKILGHIDDGHHPCDYYEVIKACKENKVLVELNNASFRNDFRLNGPENQKKMIEICKELKCPVVIDSDSHIKYDIGNITLAYKHAKDCGLSDDLIANINTSIIDDYFNF